MNLQSLSSEERDRELEEIRQHLDSLVEANRESGLSESEAVAAAIHSFDSEYSVAYELNRVGIRGRLQALPEIVRIALFTWSAELCVSLVNFVAVRPIQYALRGAHPRSNASYFQSPTVWLGAVSLIVLLFAFDWRNLIREMRSIATPWGVAVRWIVLCSLFMVPYGLLGTLYWTQYPPSFMSLSVIVYQVLGFAIYLLTAYWVGRAAPSRAYWGIIVAALIEAALYTISLIMPLTRHSLLDTSELSAIFRGLALMVLWTAAPVLGAVAGGKRWHLRRA